MSTTDTVERLMDFIDGAIGNAAEDTFVALAQNYGPIITTLCILALVFYGLTIGLGFNKVRVSDFWQLFWRIVLINLFGLTWSNFAVLYGAVDSVSDGLVAVVFSVANTNLDVANATELADIFSGQAQEASSSVIRAEGSITRGVLGAIMYILLALLQMAYIVIAGFGKMMVGVLLGLAPFAIAATIFDRTKFLFEAWMSSLIGYFMYPVAAAGVMGFIVSVSTEAFTSRTDETLLGITGVVVVILVGIFALLAIRQVASNITGQLNLADVTPEALNIVSSPLRRVGSTSGYALSQVASGATTGGDTIQRAEQARRYGSKTDMQLASLGAKLANNKLGRFAQRRRDLQFAREANERMRARSKNKDPK